MIWKYVNSKASGFSTLLGPLNVETSNIVKSKYTITLFYLLDSYE